jgi:hypothetical protein
MIHVSKSQLEQVQYLIQQSLQGNHILFDGETVRKVLRDQAPISAEDAYAVEHHIERLILEPSLERKRAYLEQLDRPTFVQVVKTYFNIVENNLFEKNEARH